MISVTHILQIIINKLNFGKKMEIRFEQDGNYVKIVNGKKKEKLNYRTVSGSVEFIKVIVDKMLTVTPEQIPRMVVFRRKDSMLELRFRIIDLQLSAKEIKALFGIDILEKQTLVESAVDCSEVLNNEVQYVRQ